jgi:hypothetical protein
MNQKSNKMTYSEPKNKKNKELYAGPVFQNSPKPSDLPIPSFKNGDFSREAEHSVQTKHSSSFQNQFLSQDMQSSCFQPLNYQSQSPQRPNEEEEMFHMEHLKPVYYPPFPPQPVYYQPDTIELEQMSKNLKNVLGL